MCSPITDIQVTEFFRYGYCKVITLEFKTWTTNLPSQRSEKDIKTFLKYKMQKHQQIQSKIISFNNDYL
jgi:hypothetical protein